MINILVGVAILLVSVLCLIHTVFDWWAESRHVARYHLETQMMLLVVMVFTMSAGVYYALSTTPLAAM